MSIPIETAKATWSIVIVNTKTKEVAIGAATCLTGFDLAAYLPVVVVDTGAAAAQSQIDFGAVNRTVIYDDLVQHVKPQTIINQLAVSDPSHQSRQYGIVDTLGRSATFTGTGAGAYKGGVTGSFGDYVYSIQGNVLAGANVITMAEQAVRNTVGDIAEKLMAGMEAARAYGGDGRCSCSPNFPNGCGSPPSADFAKAAHIGFMIIGRSGDTNGGCDPNLGCATGDYFQMLNVAFQEVSDPDPIFQLRDLFDQRRASLEGQPDAVQSVATFDPPFLVAHPGESTTLSVHLRDWQGNDTSISPLDVSVAHDTAGDAVTDIGPVIFDDAGDFHFTLMASNKAGVDRLRVVVEGGMRPIVLLPIPELHVYSPFDANQDDDVDKADYQGAPLCLSGPDSPEGKLCTSFDADGDGDFDLVDFRRLQNDFTSEHCVQLDIPTQPIGHSINCGSSFGVSVVADAEPPPYYQWFLNGSPISGANASSYFVAVSKQTDFGDYFVRLTNQCGSIDSNVATFTARHACP